MKLELKDISKSFDGKVVLKNINLTIEKPSIFCLLGPSGCGKTTLLNIIAGFIQADSGAILLNEKNISSTPSNRRNIATIFQSYALFPHMNVFNNVAYGLKIRKFSREAIRERVFQYLQLVKMEDFANRSVLTLSGGQKQRVAIARSLVIEPSLCLLDEPFCNLDLNLRLELRRDLKKLQQSLAATMIFVTHDVEEALSIADTIATIDDGRVEGIYSIEEIKKGEVSKSFSSRLNLDKFLYINNSFYKRVDES